MGRRDFADTVSDDSGRDDPPFLPDFDERHLNRKNGGLGDLGFPDVRRRFLPRQFIDQMKAAQCENEFVALFDPITENGAGLEQLAAHSGPLGALAAEDKNNARACRGDDLTGNRARAAFAALPPSQFAGDHPGIVARDEEPMMEA